MSYEFDTRCIHGNSDIEREHSYGAVTMPIYQTATFAHPGVGKSTSYDYTRAGNPTRNELEQVVTSLEGGTDTVACASGMAAIGLMMELFETGSNIICTEDLYGGSVRMFDHVYGHKGITFTYVNTSDAEATERAITEQTKAIFIETPSNPTMLVTDLRKMREIADRHGLWVIVDNTFLSPYFQRPFEYGADIVLHSGTKFLGGHNDTLAGFLCVRDTKIAERVRFLYKTIGSGLSPFDSFLIARGIKTLPVRMERQQENAIAIANWLKECPRVEKVYYVGLPEHPGYEINRSQASGSGSMISFVVDSAETARWVLEHIRLITYAESLGGVESLMTYPILQTHADVPVETRERLGINDRLLRLSVGIENVADLIRDLEQAFSGR